MPRLLLLVVLSACGAASPVAPGPAAAVPDTVPEPDPDPDTVPEPDDPPDDPIVRLPAAPIEWSPTAPRARAGHVAAFTGELLVVFGGDVAYPSEVDGYAPVVPQPVATGGRYELRRGRWLPMSTEGAPTARYASRAAWSAGRLVVWGGLDGPGAPLGDGGRYDPRTDRWAGMARTGAPAPRARHSLLAAGDAVLVWGGEGARVFGDGARYDVREDRWRALGQRGAPSARRDHGAAWTGQRMVVFGGRGPGGDLGDGAVYDPRRDVWQRLPTDAAPAPRRRPVVAWTGTELLVYGGVTGPEDAPRPLTDGARWHPETGWRPLAPGVVPRVDLRGVWTGTHLVVVGEVSGDVAGYPRPTVGVYDPRADRWTHYATFAALSRPVVLGAGELLLWGGDDGTNLVGDGARVSLPRFAQSTGAGLRPRQSR